ncbi:MAG: recombinase family protein [Eubacterium sp.]
MNEYIMYLRKSRADNPDETVEEVLQKHYTILQEFCKREFGFEIPEENIYREVISGESISERVEIKKVLSAVESKNIKGIIVVEPQRLSRGDLIDCGTLIDTLRYSNTVVVTPIMTYDMNNKMERRFFQDELMRGRDYLEYVKEILMRGRVASVKRGCYIGSTPPFGYDIIRIGKDNTLQPNENADYVRLIFDMFVNEHKSMSEIAREMNAKGIKTTANKEFSRESVRRVLQNYHYTGKVFFQRRKEVTTVIDGNKVIQRKRQELENCLCVQGKHPALIDEEIFNKAQARLKEHLPVKMDKQMRNAFAGIIFCTKCGKPMQYKCKPPYSEYLSCKTTKCSHSVRITELTDKVAQILEYCELPQLEVKYKNGDGNSVEIQKKILVKLEKELEEMIEQEEMQYELLETKKYTQDLFDKRNKALRAKMSNCEKQIAEAKRNLPDAIDYSERIATLKETIEALKDNAVSIKAKNVLLKSVIERIDYTSKDSGYDLKIKLRL